MALLALGCGHAYTCCAEGRVDTCHCPPGANCLEAIPFETHADGSCTVGSRADSGAATDTEVATDTGCEDTGESVTMVAELHVVGGAFDAAELGTRHASGCLGECEIAGFLRLVGDAPAACPDCAWSFDLGPVEASVATGACEAFGVFDGDLDGGWDVAWGFAYSYDYYMPYGEPPRVLEDVLFIWGAYGGERWAPIAFDERGFAEVDWDGETLRATWRPGGPGWE